MAYTVVRTDKMSGTKQPADLVSLRFYTTSTEGGQTVYTAAAVENGVIAELKGLEGREVEKAVAASASSDFSKCVLIAAPEVDYDERKRNLSDYVNEAGKIVRGYVLRSRNEFSVTKEGFVNQTVPTKGATIGVGTGGKLVASGTGFGTCVDIETAGRYTYYVIRIGNTEADGVGAVSLAGLTDVDLTTAPTNGQKLTYNGTTSKWNAATN